VIYNDFINDWHDKVLIIVEDDEAGYQYFESLLRKTGLQILRMKNGFDIINYIAGEDNRADIILMDILIPLKNGIDATREIKKIKHSIPVIIVTAYASKEIREKSFMAGCDAYLTKPVLPHTLLKTVAGFIEGEGVKEYNRI